MIFGIKDYVERSEALLRSSYWGSYMNVSEYGTLIASVDYAGIRRRRYDSGYVVLGAMNQDGLYYLLSRHSSLIWEGYTVKYLADGTPYLAYKHKQEQK